MSIYKSAVKNPITTMMVFLAIIVFGLYSLTKSACGYVSRNGVTCNFGNDRLSWGKCK